MKQYFVRFTILITALMLGGIVLAACSSAANNANSNEKAATGTAQGQPENVQANIKETPKPAPTAETNGLPEFKKGDDYKTSVREKMLKAGWKPARSKDADWCGSAEIVCDAFDEYEASTGKDLISFRWQKGNKFVEILTAGESQTPDSGYTYDSYVLEKDSMTVAQRERWEEFWNEFKTAINKKDKEKLKYLMTEKIDGGGAVETREERIAAIEESDMWASMQKTVAAGTKDDKCDKPCRATKDGYLIFSYESASWKWSGLGGEGGGI